MTERKIKKKSYLHIHFIVGASMLGVTSAVAPLDSVIGVSANEICTANHHNLIN